MFGQYRLLKKIMLFVCLVSARHPRIGAAMTARAERAEHREMAHQDWAANQIHALREKLRQQALAARDQGIQHEQFMRAYREVIALRKRVAQLEGRTVLQPDGPDPQATDRSAG